MNRDYRDKIREELIEHIRTAPFEQIEKELKGAGLEKCAEAKAGQHETIVMRIDTALDDWVRTYAPEFCDKKKVDESRKRITDSGGTLAYIAELKEELSKLNA